MFNLSRKLCLSSVFIASLGSVAGFAQSTTETKNAVVETKVPVVTLGEKAAKFESIDKHDMTIEFKKSTSSLATTDKESIDALIKALPPSTKRLKLTIAAWSDKDFPMDKNVKLAALDEKLAEKRIDTVVKYLKRKVKFDSIEKVNMAKHANIFSQYFSTDDAMVKAAFEGADPKKPWVAYEAKKLRDNGGPSKVVIVIYDKVGLDD